MFVKFLAHELIVYCFVVERSIRGVHNTAAHPTSGATTAFNILRTDIKSDSLFEKACNIVRDSAAEFGGFV